jgi:hypothetical protein
MINIEMITMIPHNKTPSPKISENIFIGSSPSSKSKSPKLQSPPLIVTEIAEINNFTPSTTYIKYDAGTKKFILKLGNNKLIGSFSVDDIIMYLISFYDVRNKICKSNISDAKIDLINKYVCKIKFNNKINHAKITLLDYSESGFMGDIEMLMIFNKDLGDVCKKLPISDLDESCRMEVKDTVDKFTINIIHYTISLIAQLKQGTVKDSVKSELVNYSIGLTYRLTMLINNKIVSLEEKQNKLYDVIKKSIILKNNLDKRIDEIYYSPSDQIEKAEQNDVCDKDIPIDTILSNIFKH